MLVPLSWLRDFAPFELAPAVLGEVFDDLGMVVEGMTRVADGLDGVVVARVLSIAPIPGADKIRRVEVDAGDGDPVQVVCGAWNFDEGDTVALAKVGAVLPGEFSISARTLKGVRSEGMLCSARELRLGDDSAGILVLGGTQGTEVAPNSGAGGGAWHSGQPLREALGLTDDVVFDLAIEANRPDAMSIAGVARDAAARLHLPFSLPESPRPWESAPRAERAGEGSSGVSVVVDAPELCPRFTALALDGIVVGDSPPEVARRLTLAGMRPINAIVDASNYVMLELGQPTHPYDLDRLPGGGLRVRAAAPGETLETLDGVVRTLGEGAHPDCLICDASDQPVGIGGVMGGASSEISGSTTRVVLEAANFAAMAIARTAKRIGLRSEASARFERGCDIDGIERSVARFCELVGASTPGMRVPGPLVDVRAPAPDRVPLALRTARVNTLLGTSLSAGAIQGYLEPLGFSVSPGEGGARESGVLAVTVPTYRPDVAREVDLIEEVARHHGYSNVARTVPASPRVGHLTAHQRERRLVRDTLAGAGLSEAMCNQLVGPGDHVRCGLPEDERVVHASDPLVREESRLRMSLLPGLLRTVAFNADRRNADLGMFEIGHTFEARVAGGALPPLPDERERLAVILAGTGVAGVGSGATGAVATLRRLASALRLAELTLRNGSAPGLHPGRAAQVLVDGTVVGVVGEIDPDVCETWSLEGRLGWFEVDLQAFLGGARRSEIAVRLTRFPSSDIDLAFMVPEAVPAADVSATLATAAGAMLEHLALFDVYRGQAVPEGQRSLAFRLRLRSLERTLTDEEVGEVRSACIAAVERAHGGRLRG